MNIQKIITLHLKLQQEFGLTIMVLWLPLAGGIKTSSNHPYSLVTNKTILKNDDCHRW